MITLKSLLQVPDEIISLTDKSVIDFSELKETAVQIRTTVSLLNKLLNTDVDFFNSSTSLGGLCDCCSDISNHHIGCELKDYQQGRELCD